MVAWGPFARVAIGFESNLIQISRKTDSLLDAFGYIGGLYGVLEVLGQVLIGSYNTYAL